MNESLEIKSKIMQESLVSLLDNGTTCLLAIEVLGRLEEKVLSYELIRNLCLSLNFFAKKKLEINYCEAPLLFCVLVVEFMEKLINISSHYKSRCDVTKGIYLSLACSIQETIQDEKSLKYYMTHSDTRNRTTFEIIAENKFYELLESDDVGMLVTKM